MGCRVVPILALILMPLAVKGAGDAPLDRATLRGLKAVSVVMDRLDPELQKGGLTQVDLQSRLESRLKDAHIPIQESAAEFVALRVTAVRGGRGPYALSVTIGLYQPVLLSRDKTMRTATATWEVETILMADPKILRQASLETIDELAGRFAAAWRSANPQ